MAQTNSRLSGTKVLDLMFKRTTRKCLRGAAIFLCALNLPQTCTFCNILILNNRVSTSDFSFPYWRYYPEVLKLRISMCYFWRRTQIIRKLSIFSLLLTEIAFDLRHKIAVLLRLLVLKRRDTEENTSTVIWKNKNLNTSIEMFPTPSQNDVFITINNM